MHSLIDKDMVELIRRTGRAIPGLPEREGVLAKFDLPYDQKAEWAVITGCQILGLMPHTLRNYSRLLGRASVSHTFLSQEYCCGNYLYRPAIAARDEAALAECRRLSAEFVGQNARLAASYGARKLIIFCSPCYPIYKYALPDTEIVFYPAPLVNALPGLEAEMDVDYYPGCYRLHKRLAPVPMELKSAAELLASVKGLKVHTIGAPKCCFSPEGLDHMVSSVASDTLLQICSGCYGQAMTRQTEDAPYKTMMLPDFLIQLMPPVKKGFVAPILWSGLGG